MSKALVIKQVNFSTNKLATVQLIEEIPCTGISLNKSSTSIGDTETLTATVTPINTTDEIVWTSSNIAIATVNNGVVTAVANGTATITATCGTHSASCTVTVALPVFVAEPGVIMVATSGSSLINRATIEFMTGRYAALGGTDGKYIAAYTPAASGTDFEDLYPYPIPEGATTITLTMDSGVAALIVFYNSEEHGSMPDGYTNSALVLDGETSASGTPYSISSWSWGGRTIPVSSVSGVNSFTLGLYFKTQTDFDNFDPANPGIGITFGFDPVS